jgi:hypothetical protein
MSFANASGNSTPGALQRLYQGPGVCAKRWTACRQSKWNCSTGEPFDVACDLAGHPLDVRKHLNEYLRLRDADVSRD